MSLLQNLLGNATEVDVAKLERDLTSLLVEGESVVKAYKLVRDMLVFTDKRLILVDKQGMTGRKREFKTIPYSSIVMFGKENAGRLDMDAEITLHLRGAGPIELKFGRGSDIDEVYRVIGRFVLT